MLRAALAILALLAACLPVRAAGPFLFSDDPALMAELEGKGHGFGALFGQNDSANLNALYGNSEIWRGLVTRVAGDVSALRAEMLKGGRVLHEVTDGNVGRIIDLRWLAAGASRFRLAGVVNRIDKRDFARLGGEGDCGEVRFIYRLAYAFEKKGKRFASRLPVSMNAVFTQKADADGGCQAAAQKWSGGDLAEALGGLAFKQLELNAQVVRFPSGLETGFGGQAAYLMRIFGIENGKLTEKTLENTPDAERLASDAALKSALAQWAAGHAGEIDGGVFVMPDEFLARKALSWSTFGSVRLGNRPYGALFKPADFSSADYSALSFIKDGAALINRLDNSTCQGCHQAGATAGFHFIGKDDASASPLNRIEFGGSPHFIAEQPRRLMWLEAAARGFEPNAYRPHSLAPPADWSSGAADYQPAAAGQPCGMDAWSCEAGLECREIARASGVADGFSQCLLPERAMGMFSGHPCVTGAISTNAAPFNDRYAFSGTFGALAPGISQTGYTCRPPKIGVPGGMAYRACTEADRNFAGFKPGKPAPREICGLAGGRAFDLCVATNEFDECLGAAVVRGNRATCSAGMPCREDYMCQSLPDDTKGKARVKGFGFCSPTYFVFQMRIDNHPAPW